MPRLPFNEPAESTEAKRERPPLSVSQVGELVRAVVGELPSRLKVVGEISNLSQRGHWFFRLKDESAVLDCVMFASAAGRVGFDAEHGMEVVASGRVDFYPPQGRVQLYVDSLRPVGQGALELRLRALVDELRELGYFDPEQKRALPLMPRTVAVVTSRKAAALQDVIDTARRRWAGCRLVLVDVRVQGDAAASEIARALRQLSVDGERLGIDTVILTRGGGSLEDLWAFNEREVADGLLECTLPVVAAIGHETDTTVAELVADLRCATPTQAAMAAVPERDTLAQQVDHLQERLRRVLQVRLSDQLQLQSVLRQRLEQGLPRRLRPAHERMMVASRRLHQSLPRRARPSRQRVQTSAQRLAAVLPRRISPLKVHLLDTAPQLRRSVERRHLSNSRRIDALDRHLQAVGPQRVLERGYTLTTTTDGSVIRSVRDAKKQTQLITRFRDGTLQSAVNQDSGPASAKRKSPNKRKTVKRPVSGSLFENQSSDES